VEEVVEKVLAFTESDHVLLDVASLLNAIHELVLPGIKLKGFDILESLVNFIRPGVLGFAYLFPGSITPLAGLQVDAHLESNEDEGADASPGYEGV
jgi:hypothetical protein